MWICVPNTALLHSAIKTVQSEPKTKWMATRWAIALKSSTEPATSDEDAPHRVPHHRRCHRDATRALHRHDDSHAHHHRDATHVHHHVHLV
eukprot:20838_5